MVCAEAGQVRAGDRLTVDGAAGRIDNLTTGESHACEPVPPHLMEMIAAGGLMAHLENRLAEKKGR